MLPKISRLTKGKDFDQVFKKGKSLKSDFLILKALKNDLKRMRVGFIVSKRVSNKATIRNKVKRILRATVLNELRKNNRPVDIIIIALPNAKDRSFLQIQKTIADFFKELI